MTDKRLMELWDKHRDEFKTAVREAIAEELAEAVELLRPFADDANKTDKRWDDNRSRGTLMGIKFTVGDCRAAARFVERIEKGRK